MLQQQTFGSSGSQTKLAIEADAFVKFDAKTVVSAIVFHLIDEKLAKTVAPDSVRRTIDRLTAKSFHPTVSRAKWIKMTNPQRLDWLLTESLILPVMADDDCATLRARRSR